jgi:hypothetical protein
MLHNTPINGLGSLLKRLMLTFCLMLALPSWATDYAGTGSGTGIPDPGSMTYTFNVTGQTAPITTIKLALQLLHGWFGDVKLELKSPGDVVITSIFNGYQGGSGSQDFAGTYTFVDPATPGAVNIWTTANGQPSSFVIPPGNQYMTSGASGTLVNITAAVAGLTTAQINGTWTLVVSDVEVIIVGSTTSATLTIGGNVAVNGACGTANGVATAASPAANLCAASNTATAITTNTNNFTWGCNGSGGGTNTAANACSAPRTYTVGTSAGAGGSISCLAGAVNGGSTTSCTAAPNAGFRTLSISGCSATPTGAGVNSYTTDPMSANCTVAATFEALVNGACGTANGTPTVLAPAANLCAAGNSATAITTNAGNYTWGCNSGNGGSNTAANACVATRVYNSISGNTVPPTGLPAAASASFTTANGGPACSFDPANTGFIASPAPYPILLSTQPHGFFRLRLQGCTPGFTARVTVNWPASLAGMTYTKYGKTAASGGNNNFYTPSNLVISGNTASFDVTDGGLGDDDLTANGTIIDPTGPVLLDNSPPLQVPTVNQWGLLLLALSLLGLGGLAGLSQGRQGRRSN